MSRHGALETAVWAVAGAALLGGGIVLGLASAALGKRQKAEDSAAPSPMPGPDPGLSKLVEELAATVAGLERRVELTAAPIAKVDAVTQRVEELERRVDQIAVESQPAPPIEQVLAAVEQMVAAKIGGLDERLTDQVHAIELLRHASVQTDVLLERLLRAVEGLSDQSDLLTPAPVRGSEAG